MTLELDSTRLQDLKSLLQDWGNKMHASLKEVQSLVGVLNSASSCVHQGRAFFSRILIFFERNTRKG